MVCFAKIVIASAIERDIERTISQHSLNSNSLILGLLKTRDIANLSKKGIHHMMYPIHHMMYPVHHMMDPPIHHMMDGVHHMMDGVHHMMDLYYIIYCKIFAKLEFNASSKYFYNFVRELPSKLSSIFTNERPLQH